jgi:prepilin-type N-terminal cleavage/methylation domain-containing protein
MPTNIRISSAKSRAAGFTLAEVIISVAVLALAIQGIILGYIMSSQRAEWSARSLAAQSIAAQGAEQARSAKWDTQAWPQTKGPGMSDELGITNYVATNALDIPIKGTAIIVSNFVSVTTVSVDPPVRQIRSDCVWPFTGRGLFTNTVFMLRAPDQ